MPEKIAQQARNVSIRGLTLRYLAVILLIALTGVLIVATVASYSSREAARQHETFELDVLSGDIGGLVRFYRQIAEALARQQAVADILQFGDVEQAVLWAKEVRNIVPDSIGVALVDTDGNVLGEPLQLKLGKQCVRDLEHLQQGQTLSQPPVHRGIPSLRHFDVVVPVNYGGESLGLLFISFSLDVLEQRINRNMGDHKYLVIREKSGDVVVEGGAEKLREKMTEGEPGVAIPGTDWLMYYSSEEEGIDPLLLYMALAVGGVIFAVTVSLVVFFSTRIFHFFSADLNLIRSQLDRVHSGADAEPSRGSTHLRETTRIMADVSELVHKIEQANSRLKQQSMHDALTGLYNRRAFDETLKHYASLARRNTPSRLVLLDLDLFKQVNDRYGHGVGDEVLKALAESLRERCRSSDILARLGGDEFALIMPGNSDADIETWFEDLEQLFVNKQQKINDGKGVEPNCMISAGSVVMDERSAGDVRSLLEMADKRLYEAKHAGRATIRY